MQRKSWQIAKAGALERLALLDSDLAEPAPDEVIVATRAIGLNFADIFACLGLYSATPRGAFVPGLEFSGIIHKTGSAVRKWKKGQKVMGVTRFGAYTTHVSIKQDYILPLPARWSFAEGAALLAQGLTAYYALFELGNFKKGQLALVHSAAGGVGLLALDLIQKAGGHAIATIGSPAKAALLEERCQLDAAQIIVRNKNTFKSDLSQALANFIRIKSAPKSESAQQGLDLILDSVMGPYFWPGYNHLNAGGRLVLFGAADLMPAGQRPNYLKLGFSYLKRPRLDPLEMISENKSVMPFNLIWMWDRIDQFKSMAGDLLKLKIRPPHIGHLYPFEKAGEALRFFQSGQSTGKVILEVELQ
jgi:alcohol dehydrogenase